VEFSGSYPLVALERLAPLLHQTEGEVGFWLSFERNADGQRVVRGKISTQLSLICQRCLTPTYFPVEREVLLGVVENLTAADQLPIDLDPLLVEGLVSVREIVEDELLLALPVVATHERDHCPADEVLKQYLPQKENNDEKEMSNPFSVLKSIT
jgi:uncharacterized protein